MSAPTHSGPRGQALVLLCLTVILLVVMACITVSIAVRTRERLEQQTLSDTVAYSNAVASARAYNTLSLINRTALAHWVSMMAVQANLSWGSLHKAWFESIADALGTFDPPGAPAPGCATQRQQEIKAARQSLIHAALSSYNAPGVSGDDVHLGHDHPNPGSCSLFDERSNNWRGRNFGKDDQRVAEETDRIYEAINDLNDIQVDLYNQLEDRVKREQVATDLVKLSRGDGSMGPYRLLNGAGDGPAWDHVSHALGRGPGDSDQLRRDSLVPFAHAAMGSRPSGYLVGGSDEEPPSALANRVQPPWTLSITNDIQNDLNAHFRAGAFRFTVEHFAVRSYLGEFPQRDPGLTRVHPGRDLGFGNVAGGAWARIHVQYRGPCGTPHEMYVWPAAESMLNRVGTSEHSFGYGMAPNPNNIPTNYGLGHASVGEGLTGTHNAYYNSHQCHPGHRHWGELNRTDHDLQGLPNPSIWPRGFGFVFPQNRGDESSFPVFGQPTLPILLARSYRPGDVAPDPWNLTLRSMKFSAAGTSGIDMRAGRLSPDQAAMSNAILYYHRRRPVRAGINDDDRVGTNGWAESPNLLNPYWHATLVRGDLDDRRTPTQGTARPIVDRAQYRMLRDEGFTSAAEAYRELDSAGFKSWQ